MALLRKVDKLEGKIKKLRDDTRSETSHLRFLDVHSRGMVLCRDNIERRWAKLRVVYDEFTEASEVDSEVV